MKKCCVIVNRSSDNDDDNLGAKDCFSLKRLIEFQ